MHRPTETAFIDATKAGVANGGGASESGAAVAEQLASTQARICRHTARSAGTMPAPCGHQRPMPNVNLETDPKRTDRHIDSK
jgi:hypothetical protein